jgi:hypothetical protein
MNMKSMIVQDIAVDGTITYNVKPLDMMVDHLSEFANAGFDGWLVKINGDNTEVNDKAPVKLLTRVYDYITW